MFKTTFYEEKTKDTAVNIKSLAREIKKTIVIASGINESKENTSLIS